jgi:voltage-gated potassium channel
MTAAGSDAAPAPAPAPAPAHGNAYNIFILVQTVASLVIMVLLWLPFSPAVTTLLRAYDNAICFIFLFDFGLNLARAPSKRGYLLGERGWLDLLGSIPALPGLEAGGILRLARLSRLARITRLLRGQNRRQMVQDVVQHRAQYAAFITVLAAFLVLTVGSIVVLAAESLSPDANITTGGDALWWAFVTITTVGYGDFYPKTTVGRIGAAFVMVMGIGIIGSLASIMASLLVSPSPAATDDDDAGDAPADLERELVGLRGELAGVRTELATLRRLVEGLDGRRPAEPPPASPPVSSAALDARHGS